MHSITVSQPSATLTEEFIFDAVQHINQLISDLPIEKQLEVSGTTCLSIGAKAAGMLADAGSAKKFTASLDQSLLDFADLKKYIKLSETSRNLAALGASMMFTVSAPRYDRLREDLSSSEVNQKKAIALKREIKPTPKPKKECQRVASKGGGKAKVRVSVDIPCGTLDEEPGLAEWVLSEFKDKTSHEFFAEYKRLKTLDLRPEAKAIEEAIQEQTEDSDLAEIEDLQPQALYEDDYPDDTPEELYLAEEFLSAAPEDLQITPVAEVETVVAEHLPVNLLGCFLEGRIIKDSDRMEELTEYLINLLDTPGTRSWEALTAFVSADSSKLAKFTKLFEANDKVRLIQCLTAYLSENPHAVQDGKVDWLHSVSLSKSLKLLEFDVCVQGKSYPACTFIAVFNFVLGNEEKWVFQSPCGKKLECDRQAFFVKDIGF